MLDRPEWNVHSSGDDDHPSVVLCSDDFTHDVCLKITGDFWCLEQRIEYANKIAKILNDAGTFVLESDADKRYEIACYEKYPDLKIKYEDLIK